MIGPINEVTVRRHAILSHRYTGSRDLYLLDIVIPVDRWSSCDLYLTASLSDLDVNMRRNYRPMKAGRNQAFCHEAERSTLTPLG